VSYIWVKDGRPLPIEGDRTPLPHAVQPSETIALDASVLAPVDPGKYTLRVTLVQEGVTWFYHVGASTLDLPATISGQAVQVDPVTAFHLWFYNRSAKTFDNTFWLGTAIEKNPLDMQIYQEIIYDTKPDVLIETGTLRGGSALFFASIFDLLKRGRVLTVDIVPEQTRPKHPRITYITGSSISEEVMRTLSNAINPGERVMVTLDSLHTRDHVLQELKLYSPLVTVGNYLIVEDSNVNGHPVLPGTGPGPMEALTAFLAGNTRFVPDSNREKYGFTFNPSGWLKRVQ
jgi:cephalosporin hydroxylase